MNLLEALRLENNFCLAVVGTGSNTTPLFQLGRDLHAPVVITTSTHLHQDQLISAGSHIIGTNFESLKEIYNEKSGCILVTGPIINELATGLDETLLKNLFHLCEGNFPLLIMADGFYQSALITPPSHESVLPNFVDTVLVVADLEVVGKPLTEYYVHKSEIFSQITQIPPGGIVTLEAITHFLLDKFGGQKGIPSETKHCLLLKHSGGIPCVPSQSMYNNLFQKFDAVIMATYNQTGVPKDSMLTIDSVNEPITAIILAAGEAKRFGTQKQLLPWMGKQLIQYIVGTTLSSNVSEVIIVTGSGSDAVEDAVKDTGIKIKRNPDWLNGISTSIRAGLSASSPKAGAAIFILADQPALSTLLINRLIQFHNLNRPKIVIPRVNNINTNPVIFDRSTFPDLMSLIGDVGGKVLFSKYPVSYLPWDDDSLLFDIDTQEDYNYLINKFT